MPRWLKITGIGCGGLLTLFVVLIIFVAILAPAPEEEPVVQQEQQEEARQEPVEEQVQEQDEQPEPEPEPEPEQPTVGIGEEVTVGDFTYTVNRAEIVSQLEDPDGFQEPLTGNFVLIDFVFTNNGSEPATLTDLYLYDSQGRQYETDTDATFYLPNSIFLLERVNPGLSQEAQAAYSVPQNTEGLELEVSSGLFASETARIDLGF